MELSEQRSVRRVARRRMMVLGLLAGVMVTGWAGAAQAGQADRGNSATASACQHDGWKQLVRGEDGSSFANQGECVAHAARGGAVARPQPDLEPLGKAYRAACTGDGGIFYEDVDGVPVFGCSFGVVEVGTYHPEAVAAMEDICETAGGAFVYRIEPHAAHAVCTLPT